MSAENREQQVDQLLRGVYRMCVNRDNCTDCPFFITKCTFGEPKPATWFDVETIVPAEPEVIAEPAAEEKPAEVAEETSETTEAAIIPQPDDDSVGTWIVSQTMGSVLSKYVYICSKCGFKKESYFSLTTMTFCPECEKKKAGT
ncbi:MAG: hypothetical protein II718_07050 [Clostridiales bacterium]|nr:hypothetical protein [Clostridiales bacterium]